MLTIFRPSSQQIAIAMEQELCTIVPNEPSPQDELGFVVNVFNLIQFAGYVIGRPAKGFYTSCCPNKDNFNSLRDILSEWKDVLNGLDPEQRARFDVDHPGEFDSMMRGIKLCVLFLLRFCSF